MKKAKPKAKGSSPSAQSTTHSPANRIPRFLPGLILVLLALAIYSRVYDFPFLTYDDPLYVSANPHVSGGLTWSGVGWAFTSGEESNWFPLTWLSHMLDCQLFGLQSGAQHLMNVAIHTIAALLLFGFLKRATQSRWPSLFVALAFTLHPLHVESVAWIAERKDVLCALFWMLTLWLYLKFVEKRTPAAYAWVLLAAACALMSKPMAVTIPITLLLVDIWPLRRFGIEKISALLIEKIPFAIMAVVVSIITFLAQSRNGALTSGEEISFAARLENAFGSYLIYLGQFFWPSRLAVLYPYPDPPSLFLAIASFLAIVMVTCFVLGSIRNRPFVVAGWFWFLLTLLPVIGLVQVGAQAHADRYMYVPSIGIAILLAWGLPELLGRFHAKRALLAISTAVVCVGWCAMTWIDLGYWQNSVTLFEHAVAVTENNFVAYNNLGDALRGEGKPENALASFEKAASIRPQSARIQDNLGLALITAGKPAEALPHLRQAVAIGHGSSAESSKVHLDLATALLLTGEVDSAESNVRTALGLQPESTDARTRLAEILAQEGRSREAAPLFEQVIPALAENAGRHPESFEDHYNLGVAYGLSGRADDAITQFEQALRLRPDDLETRMALGNALLTQHRAAESIDQFSAAVHSHPDNARAHLNLGRALASANKFRDAANEDLAALQLMNTAEGHYNLGLVYALSGRVDQAIAELREATRLQPDYADAHFNLGTALAMKNRANEAIEEFRETERLNPNYPNIHLSLGKTLSLVQKQSEAADEYRAALKSDPSSSEARHALQQLSGRVN